MTNERLRQSIEQLTKDTAAERIKRREEMDNLIAQDADLIEICSDDLVQRLRADVFYGDARLANMDKHNPLHMDAADCIEAQAAEIEWLRVEVKAQYDRGYYDGYTHPLERSK